MRIISGIHGGRTIKAVKGSVTRPTGNRVREAVFSSLTALPFDFEGAVVADLFAGSGAYGFEALSRGAARAIFTDTDSEVLKMLNQNSVSLNETSRAKIIKNDSLKYPTRVADTAGFDLIFLDPPYRVTPQEVMEMLGKLATYGAINDNATVVFEHDSKQAIDSFGPFSLEKTKKYGTASISYLSFTKE